MPLGNPIRKQNESRMVSVLATEGQTVFTIQGGYIINHISVFRNGVRLSNAEDFTAGDGSTVTLNNAANIDDRIEFHVFDRFTVQNAIVSAASTQTISGDIVVNGKIFGNLDVPQINVASGIVTTHDLNVTGIVTATELDLNGKADISSDLTVTRHLNVSGISTFQNNVHLLDSDRLQIGGSAGTVDGLEIYHDSNHSYIADSGTGELRLRANVFNVQNAAGDETLIGATENDSVALYFNNNQKLVTTNTGVIVTGILTATEFNVADKIVHTGDTNTAIRFPTADTVTVETAGSERIRIDSSGNFGIGTNNPSYKTQLSVSDTTAYSASTISANQFQLAITNSGAAGVAGILLATEPSSGNGGHCGIRALSTGSGDSALTFSTRGSATSAERLRITSDGKIGINETSPGQRLTVGGDIQIGFNTPTDAGRQLNFNVNRGSAGDTLANINWQWNSKFVAQIRGIAGADTTNKDDAHLAFFTSSANNLTERMRIDSAGKVGINRTPTQHPLEVQHASEPTISFWRGSTKGAAVQAQSGGTYLYSYQGAPLLFSTNAGNGFSERMRIISTGEVSIGGFTPTAGDGILQLNGGLRIAGSASASDTTSPYIYRTSGVDNLNFATNGVERVKITSAGLTRLMLEGNSTLVEPLRIENTGSGGGANVGMIFYNGNGSTGAGALARIKANDEGSYDSSLSFETGLKSNHGDTTIERMRITQTGYMALGNTSPQQLLHVWPDTDNTNTAAVRVTAGNRAGTTGIQMIHDSNGNGQIQVVSNGGLYFATNDTVRMSLRNDHPDLVVGAVGGWNDYGTVQAPIMAYGTSAYPANSHVIKGVVANTSYSEDGGGMFFLGARRSTTNDYTMAGWYTGNSSNSITSDRQFRFIADGNAYADGSWNGGGADYAEFFEWLDGNSGNENRKGISVVLENGKIRAATGSDNTDNIIGVISANPVVVGDSASERWKEKWITDDFGDPVYEEYTITEWYDETKKEKVNYATDSIPSDVTVGAGSSVLSTDHNGNAFTRKKLNPSWDSTATYIPRKDRKEWDIVGLMGKLKVKSDQPIGTKWIKIREISASVHEYLIR
tara:strand:+ start:2244 stop:5474 length:3231 start_codon:yes stop_codon:yes gene_type:complete